MDAKLYLNLFGFQAVRLPRAVENFFGIIGNFVTSLLPSRDLQPRANPAAMAMGTGPMGPTAGPMAGFQGPSEADIATLTSMGFDRSAVIQALQITGSVDAAANMLLR